MLEHLTIQVEIICGFHCISIFIIIFAMYNIMDIIMADKDMSMNIMYYDSLVEDDK